MSVHVVICYQSQHKKIWRGLEREREGAGGDFKYLYLKEGLLERKPFLREYMLSQCSQKM